MVKVVVRERREVTDSARGKEVVRERSYIIDSAVEMRRWGEREVTESAREKRVGGQRRDVTDSSGGKWSFERDVMLQAVKR